MSLDTSSMQVFNDRGLIANVADLVIGDPVDDDGFVYRDVALTIPFVNPPQVGTRLKVVDQKTGEVVCSFVATAVLMQVEHEMFHKISGQIILALPKRPQ